MRQDRPKKLIISTGTTSIVLIFVMLCMLTFSVLSLTSAQANLRLSRLSAERTTNYYEAENAANDILIRVNEVLDTAYPSSDDPEVFYAFANDSLSGVEDIDFPDETHLTYQVPLGDSQVLSVELELLYEPSSSGRHYTVLSWQAVSGYDWSPDDTLNLMGGSPFLID